MKSVCRAGLLEPLRTDAYRTLAAPREPLKDWIDELTSEAPVQ